MQHPDVHLSKEALAGVNYLNSLPVKLDSLIHVPCDPHSYDLVVHQERRMLMVWQPCKVLEQNVHMLRNTCSGM